MSSLVRRCVWGLVLALAVLGPAHGVDYGALGGVSLNWLGGRDWQNELSDLSGRNALRPELGLGGFLEFPLSRTWVFRPEFQAVSLRGEGRGSLGPDSARIQVEARVLQLPLLIRARYPTGSGVFYGILGPTLNFLLTEIRTETTIGAATDVETEDPYYGLVVGVAAGLGYEPPIPSVRITADLRYHLSLSPIFQGRALNFQSLAFLLGLAFPLSLD